MRWFEWVEFVGAAAAAVVMVVLGVLWVKRRGLFRGGAPVCLSLALIASAAMPVLIDTVDPPSASAWTASCVFAPASSAGYHSYAGSFCSTNRIGGAFHYTIITCRYYQLWQWHTYSKQGPRASDGEWSWAYCSNGDEVIHVTAGFYPNDQYNGGGGSGSW